MIEIVILLSTTYIYEKHQTTNLQIIYIKSQFDKFGEIYAVVSNN